MGVRAAARRIDRLSPRRRAPNPGDVDSARGLAVCGFVHRMSDGRGVRHPMFNFQRRMPNAERRTPNAKRQTPNVKRGPPPTTDNGRPAAHPFDPRTSRC
ncbi:hypothetical protein DM56_3567 [Burkholderia mallei]|nr:hypothetical protein DM45_3969 [Burkholderia mallei]KOT10692.1 hypothetical protein DM56_3567 [Burkholderia mallei]KOT16611.1 hypothetical protein DM47_2980 [Burkholderia mallei]